MNPPIESVPPEDTTSNTSAGSEDNAEFSSHIEPSPKRKSESYYTKPDPTPLWKIVLEVLVAVAVIAYTIVASLQLKTMNKSYEEIAKQTPHITEAASAATQANTDASNRFQQDERPYVWLNLQKHPEAGVAENARNTGSFINYFDGRLLWSFHFANFGKSPAVKFKVLGDLVIADDCVGKKITLKDSPSDPTGVLIQGQEQYVTRGSEPMTEERYKTEMGKDLRVCIFGRAIYFGMDGARYDSDFCFSRFATGAVVNCPTNKNKIK